MLACYVLICFDIYPLCWKKNNVHTVHLFVVTKHVFKHWHALMSFGMCNHSTLKVAWACPESRSVHNNILAQHWWLEERNVLRIFEGRCWVRSTQCHLQISGTMVIILSTSKLVSLNIIKHIKQWCNSTNFMLVASNVASKNGQSDGWGHPEQPRPSTAASLPTCSWLGRPRPEWNTETTGLCPIR